ncbi:MAG: NAD-dependent epimerase/dehydratase family protein [Planctomycetes bacterium]|nr:NAD-dependent epimerase/dehydratase family protein [Planctomycetota bacterium]MCB9869482.1 NAD-dependent epimerase/dehydratase family protein [Planctomycetota bacterium]
MPRYLVTGGAGFIGSHLTEALLANGDSVVVFDNFSSGKRGNLEHLDGPFEVVEGSITDLAALDAALRGCQGVFHLAAVPSVPRSVKYPLESHEANATGTILVLDAARRAGCKVVYAGSSSAYGDQDVAEKHEELRERPMSPYAAAKLAGELNCRAFANVYGLPIVVTRFFNVFGPRQVPDSPYSGVVAAFSLALLRGTTPVIHGTGAQSRDFTFVADVARGCILAMQSALDGCHVVNLACGGSHSVLDILRGLAHHAGVTVEPEFLPARTGDVMNSRADITRARELLGFAPQVSLLDGLRITYDWYRSVYA